MIPRWSGLPLPSRRSFLGSLVALCVPWKGRKKIGPQNIARTGEIPNFRSGDSYLPTIFDRRGELTTFVARYPSCALHGGDNRRGCAECDKWRRIVNAGRA
jgi:hypothetical protein